MSDTLLDLVNHWQQHLQLILPVAGAIILVIVVYLCGLGSAPPPQLILADESVSTKKEKALAKKRLKQQQSKKPKPSNGHVVEPARSQPSVQAGKVQEKPAVEVKKPSKTQVKKSAAKEKTQVAPVKDAKAEAAQAASRQERAQMKKDANQGEWVTVVSGKEKKAKQAQVAAEESEKLAEAARKAIIEEAQRLTAEAEAKNSTATSDNKSKTDSSIKSTAGDKSSKSSKSKNSKGGNKSESSPKSNIPALESTPPSVAQPDVRPKDPKPAVVEASSVPVNVDVAANADGDKSLQEKIAEAMEPAFDEMGEWEEAKPLKMKNVKKRARRDK